jgi:SAM-dependent methyltransferase
MAAHLLMQTKSTAPPEQRAQFLNLIEGSLTEGTFVKLVLAKYHGPEEGLLRVIARRLSVRGEPCLSLTYRYQTKDVTKNIPVEEALHAISEVIGAEFENAHLLTTAHDIQLAVSRKGKYSLRTGRAEASPPPEEHDREKKRFLEQDRPFLTALGVTDDQHRVVPAMSRKWKQINKFLEVLDHAFATSKLKESGAVRVVDYGCGKGYLTFAVHDYLRNRLGLEAHVTGVELRVDLVRFCNATVDRLGLEGLSFEKGDIRGRPVEPTDVMIALHACDTATDYALHAAIRSDASIVMCAPCCHKELRPQMQAPPLLRPLFQHGIHLGQEAEMVTDGLRALLLEGQGYEAKIFEFVALEHTSKNKMILAVKKNDTGNPASARAAALSQVRELKAFYGIGEQSLEKLLQADTESRSHPV